MDCLGVLYQEVGGEEEGGEGEDGEEAGVEEPKSHKPSSQEITALLSSPVTDAILQTKVPRRVENLRI